MVAVPELGCYEHVFAFEAAVAECAANVGFVVVDSRGVNVAISYLERVFYCFLGCLSWWRLVYSEAEARNHDSIVEPGERLDCSLHENGELLGSHFNLNPTIFRESLGTSAMVCVIQFTFGGQSELSRSCVARRDR